MTKSQFELLDIYLEHAKDLLAVTDEILNDVYDEEIRLNMNKWLEEAVQDIICVQCKLGALKNESSREN